MDKDPARIIMIIDINCYDCFLKSPTNQKAEENYKLLTSKMGLKVQ